MLDDLGPPRTIRGLVPDPAWSYTDRAGHAHRHDDRLEPLTGTPYPTLVIRSAITPCTAPGCGCPGTEASWYECPRCREVVHPGEEVVALPVPPATAEDAPPASPRRPRLLVPFPEAVRACGHRQLPDAAEAGPFVHGGVVEDRRGRRWGCGPLFKDGVWLGSFAPQYPVASRWLDAPLARHAKSYRAVYVDGPAPTPAPEAPDDLGPLPPIPAAFDLPRPAGVSGPDWNGAVHAMRRVLGIRQMLARLPRDEYDAVMFGVPLPSGGVRTPYLAEALGPDDPWVRWMWPGPTAAEFLGLARKHAR